LTYISPLDTASPLKTSFGSPTKLRRHQENQAAMGRYWQRTEEEEAQERAEAQRRAAEEAERYRNEPPASRIPVPQGSTRAIPTSPKHPGNSWAERVEKIDKLPEVLEDLDKLPTVEGIESFPPLDDKLETEESDSDGESTGSGGLASGDASGATKPSETQPNGDESNLEDEKSKAGIIKPSSTEESDHTASDPMLGTEKVSTPLLPLKFGNGDGPGCGEEDEDRNQQPHRFSHLRSHHG